MRNFLYFDYKDTKICLIYQDYELLFVIIQKKNMKNLQSLIFLCIFVDNYINTFIMRILYVTDALAVWGGIERVLSDKMNYLVREYGYEVYVVTADQGNHQIPFPLDERIHVKDLNIRFHQQYKYHGIRRLLKYKELERLYRNRLKTIISEIRPDVVSCIRDGYASAVLDMNLSMPIIFESHAMRRDVKFEKASILHRFVTYLNRRKFKKLNKLVTLTNGDAHDWKKICKKLTVIPNVVHLNESGQFSSCLEKKVVFAGRFDLQKNIGSLIEVWIIVQQRHPDWVLNVYGNGELKPYYEQKVSEMKLNIHIHPAVPDIFNKYKESSMLLMTSLYEPFGLVLVEAMSCGLPVVAFNCPYGPADIITDGADGFLVEEGNIEAFADRVCMLMDDFKLRKNMGKNAVISSKRYSDERIMPYWEHLFKELTTKG